jgi:spore coat protein CotH
MLFVNTPDFVPIVSKEVWIDGASYKLIDENDGILSGTISIKGRGNTTWGMPKKPLTIKLPKNEDKPFLGMPSHRNWVLLANYSDKTLLRTDVAFKLGEILDNLKWTPRSRHIHLYLNQEYQGVYQLVEQIKIDPNRVNIAPAISSKRPDGGYIMEVDVRRGEIFNFFTNRGVVFNCKDPDENLDNVFEKIKTDIQKLEDIIYSDSFADTATGYWKYFDVNSIVDWYLANEITKNNDAIFFSSVYMYYNPTNKKFCMGPLWDYDIALGNVNYGSCGTSEGFYIKGALWISRLFEDPAFVELVKARWNEKRTHFYTLLSHINDQSAYLISSQKINFKKWDILDQYVWPNSVVAGSYEGEIKYLISWVNNRLQWLDINMNLLD